MTDIWGINEDHMAATAYWEKSWTGKWRVQTGI